MIERISIRNFKSLRSVDVELSPVTVLIGRSGVGKSNFLRAIRFLRDYLLLGEIAIELEGGSSRIRPFGESVTMAFDVHFRLPGHEPLMRYQLSLAAEPMHDVHRGSTAVELEALHSGQDVLFERQSGEWKALPGKRPPAPRTYDGPDTCLDLFPSIPETVLAFTAWTSGVGWHDFPGSVFYRNPPSRGSGESGRGGTKTGQRRGDGLADRATNHLAVIQDMTRDLRNQRARRQVLSRLRQINPSVTSIELDSVVNPQAVVVGHLVGESRMTLDLAQESDGFRRYYAHLLALYQTPPKQVLMFEEPENGIYPGALRNLAEEFRAAPEDERGQVLLTTQSPDLLDGFDPEHLRVVELGEDQTTRIGPLDPDQLSAVRDHLLEPGELLTVDTARAAHAHNGGAPG